MFRANRPLRWTLTAILCLCASLVTPRLTSHAPAAHAAASDGHLGEVRYIYHGLAFWAPKQKPRSAHLHTHLFSQYSVRTGANQKASVGFIDGTVLHLNNNTDATLTAHNTYVRSGEVAQYLQPGTDHTVQTGDAVATAIGTTFDIRVAGTTTTLVVLHGALQVSGNGGAVVVKSDHETVVAGTNPPTPPTKVNARAVFAWTDQIPTPDLGEDVALDANGGAVVAASSQRHEARWHATHIDDGLLSFGWESAQGKTRNQTVRIAFTPRRLYRIFEVIIDPAATGGDPASMDLKDFQIRVSSTGTASADFTTVYTGRCKQQAKLFIFKLPTPVLARYVELVALDNHGSSRGIAVAEFESVANVAGMAFPSGLVVDKSGDIIVADTGNDRILKLDPEGKPLASWGTKGDAPGRFRTPIGLTLDAKGDIYVADNHNNRVQELSPQGTVVRVIGSYGSGPGQFNLPEAVALDAKGDLYVTDFGNNRIEEFSPGGAYLRSIGTQGTGPGQLNNPLGLALDTQGNIYVSDYGNARIQKFSPSGTSLALWGTIGSAPGQFSQPEGIAVDASGNVYVADTFNNRVQKFSPAGTLLAVSKRTKTKDDTRPSAIAVDARGRIFVSQYGNSHIVRMSADLKPQATVGVFGTSPQLLAFPIGVAVDGSGQVYVTDPLNGRVQIRTPAGRVGAVIGHRAFLTNGSAGPSLAPGQFGFPIGIAVAPNGTIYVPDQDLHRIVVLSPTGPLGYIGEDGTPRWIAVDSAGDLYILDAHNDVEKLSPKGVLLATLGASANLNRPQGLAVDAAGNIYVAEGGAARIVRLTPSGAVSGYLGEDAGLNGPQSIAVDTAGNVYVADTGNNRIVKLAPDGRLLAVLGSSVQFDDPTGVAVDAAGNVYVADRFNDRVVKLAPDGSVAAIWN
jgi:tripartite motif-containing protein 71